MTDERASASPRSGRHCGAATDSSWRHPSPREDAPVSPTGRARVDSQSSALLDSTRSFSDRRSRARPVLAMISLAVALACSADRRSDDPLEAAPRAAPIAPANASTLGSSPADRGSLSRAESIRALSGDAPGDVQRLVASLEDSDPLVRGTAAAVLMRRADASAVRTELEKHRGTVRADEAHPPERKLLEYDLVRRAGSSTRAGANGARICDAALREPSPLERSRAAAICVASGSPGADWLALAAGDPHWAVRTRVAAELVRRTHDDLDRVALARLADDPHPTVRAAARRIPASTPESAFDRDSRTTPQSAPAVRAH